MRMATSLATVFLLGSLHPTVGFSRCALLPTRPGACVRRPSSGLSYNGRVITAKLRTTRHASPAPLLLRSSAQVRKDAQKATRCEIDIRSFVEEMNRL